MAITVTTPGVGSFGWIANGVSADATGCEELRAAPAATEALNVDVLTINNGSAANSITIGAGETGGAVTTALIGPIAMAINTSLVFDFKESGGMKLADATSLTVDASSAGTICVFVQGRTT